MLRNDRSTERSALLIAIFAEPVVRREMAETAFQNGGCGGGEAAVNPVLVNQSTVGQAL